MYSDHLNGTKKRKILPIRTTRKIIDLQQRLEKTLNDVIRFNKHVNNIKEMITYFKYKKRQSKKRSKKYKTVNTILESVETIVIIRATSASITLSITCVGLVILSLSAGIPCTFSLGNKLLQKLVINKNHKYRKQYEKDKQSNLLINFIESPYKLM